MAHGEITVQIDRLLAQSMKELTILRAITKHLLAQQPGHRIRLAYADLAAAADCDALLQDDGEYLTLQLARPAVPSA